ncbi:hypothetical protein [Mesorhizobium sp. M4B.F.Ca.ET.058.02.1.1]|uniref:hypothetical protein n=1 Tax=Mesorhizobium sp. M4B.F.Ca.ET.058.02.1.1 TaxID=2493675 RepID=UPI000F74F456|nr:hypothetical protein [Mesorhizobium sp. M4B.F.Ca.ET.058.02.1.1]AZO48085.1 hypothetical protein EJ073_09840 [Mesorhizobium sp. M4B.F.Ca.ET.058.02.1.1]
MTDTQRVELSLPVHIMLSVLVSGANCAEPAGRPTDISPAGVENWKAQWHQFNERLGKDPIFQKSYQTFRKTRELLVAACSEALAGVYPEKKEMSLLRRIERIHTEIVEPYVKADNPDPRKIGIIAFYLLQHLVETRTIIVPEDSSFGKALEFMLPALSPWEGSTEQEIQDYEALNRSAQKQVRKILLHLQQEGYYKYIPIPLAA